MIGGYVSDDFYFIYGVVVENALISYGKSLGTLIKKFRAKPINFAIFIHDLTRAQGELIIEMRVISSYKI
jgi:hypothetical protein